ncbi:uncharacterized protein [Musca autumnalis]|uniref:uncharacterized protein n=1 Tax=Musca autumnalis TaxID=221902 RepID=UPI003CE8C7B3
MFSIETQFYSSGAVTVTTQVARKQTANAQTQTEEVVPKKVNYDDKSTQTPPEMYTNYCVSLSPNPQPQIESPNQLNPQPQIEVPNPPQPQIEVPNPPQPQIVVPNPPQPKINLCDTYKELMNKSIEIMKNRWEKRQKVTEGKHICSAACSSCALASAQGEKRIKCQMCYKAFSRCDQLAAHSKTHVKPWECPVCHQSFLAAYQLLVHFKEQHPK